MTDPGDTKRPEQHHFNVVRGKINIFPDAVSRNMLEGVDHDETVVFVSIGPGETHITMVNGDGMSIDGWTAVFGWSSLCDIEIPHAEGPVFPVNKSMIIKSLRSTLRLYGQKVDTDPYVRSAKGHLKSALSYILDKTIGDAKEVDRIVIAAPDWMHPTLGDCIRIRPHIDPDIQEL
ncbi:hypothetical protein [Pseudosulfitobacter pseudonitzschiae]|uniref:hypothetical protein n=1 Tax=Pseudosulfitobacter pseudonitzschiae TaxID=1402135 RepID=UPI003B81F5DE